MTNSHNFAGSGALRRRLDRRDRHRRRVPVGTLPATAPAHTGAVVTTDLTLDSVKLIRTAAEHQRRAARTARLTGVSAWRLDQVGATGNVASFGDTAATLATGA